MKNILALAMLLSSPAFGGTEMNGSWRGQVEFRANANGGVVEASHSVTEIEISIEPGGKLTGRSLENGCSILGLAKKGPTDYMMTVGATLSGCKYKDMNARFQGNIVYFKKDGTMTMTLAGTKVSLGSKVQLLHVEANLQK